MATDLRTLLSGFDGVHTDMLEATATSLKPDSDTLEALCELALSDEGRLQSAATWLLKRYLESGSATPNLEQSEALLLVLQRDSHWEAKLHVLQMLDQLTLGAGAAPKLWDVLQKQAGQQNKLLRAWSVHGLAVIADQCPEYRELALASLLRAEADEAASVRARIRRLRKTYPWLARRA